MSHSEGCQQAARAMKTRFLEVIRKILYHKDHYYNEQGQTPRIRYCSYKKLGEDVGKASDEYKGSIIH
ncbi:MAG: hypothetical protein Q8Q49_00025 [bacterium]|nr:hypothetical protein [bacterium]